MRALSFDPLISPALWVALAMGAGAVMAVYAVRRPGNLSKARWWMVLGIMALAMAILLVVLLNPTWTTLIPPPQGKPLLNILVDASASMATADGGPERTRWQAACDLATALEKDCSDQFDVRIQTFAAETTPAESVQLPLLSAKGRQTDIAAALGVGSQGEPSRDRAIVLLSDGIHNAEGATDRVLEAVRATKAVSTPIYVRTFGGQPEDRNVRISFRTPYEVAFVGQEVPLTVQAAHRGLNGAAATIECVLDGNVVERASLNLQKDGVAALRFVAQHDKPGLYRYEARTPAVPGERTSADNVASLVLRVVDHPTKVLLVEGKPYWDTKFLIRTLAADLAIELDSVVRMSEGRFLKQSYRSEAAAADTPMPDSTSQPSKDASPALHVSRWEILSDGGEILGEPKRLGDYQVVVIGRQTDEYLTDSAVAHLRKWISQDGGTVVCFRGSPLSHVGQQLAKLLPVRSSPARESRFRLNLTASGRAASWLGGSEDPSDSGALPLLPALSTDERINQLKPAAVVLAYSDSKAGTENPVVTYQRYGTGRIVFIEGAGMWRWAFLSPAHKKLDDVYTTLWRGMMRWLVSNAGLLPGESLRLVSDKVTFSDLEPATATLLVRAESSAQKVPSIKLMGAPSGSTDTFMPAPFGDEPGVFRVSFGRLPEGHYEARIADRGSGPSSAAVIFEVRDSGREQTDLAARPELMARIASESGGAVLSGDSPRAINRLFKEHLQKSRPSRVDRATAWDRWWVLLGCFSIWATSWGIRRYSGLV